MADTIHRVGHIMGLQTVSLQTVGESAESAEVNTELRSLGVDFAQGYGVQRPKRIAPPRTHQAQGFHTHQDWPIRRLPRPARCG